MDPPRKEELEKKGNEIKATFKRSTNCPSDVTLRFINPQNPANHNQIEHLESLRSNVDPSPKPEPSRPLRIRQGKTKQQQHQVMNMIKRDEISDEDMLRPDKGTCGAEYYCDIGLLKQMLRFFIGIISHFKNEPNLKLKFDEFGFINIDYVERYFSAPRGSLLPSLKNSSKPFYEIMDDKKVRFDYQMFLENFCKPLPPSVHHLGMNGVDREFFIVIDAKNACPCYCGFGACSIYIVQKGLTVYQTFNGPLSNSDKLVLPFKLHPLYEEKLFPLCNYLFQKYKYTKSVSVYQNRQNLEVAFIPRTFIEWEKASSNILPVVAPNLVSIDRYFIGGNKEDGFFLLVVDRISGKTETLMFDSDRFNSLVLKLSGYVYNYSNLRECSGGVSFHAARPVTVVDISSGNSGDHTTTKQRSNTTHFESVKSTTVVGQSVHFSVHHDLTELDDEGNHLSSPLFLPNGIAASQKAEHTGREVLISNSPLTSSECEKDGEDEQERAEMLQKVPEKNSFGFIPAGNSNAFPICLVGTVEEIMDLAVDLRDIIANPNVMMVDRCSGEEHLCTKKDKRDMALGYITDLIESSKGKTVVSHGYYSQRRGKVVVTLDRKHFEKIQDPSCPGHCADNVEGVSCVSDMLVHEPRVTKSLELLEVEQLMEETNASVAAADSAPSSQGKRLRSNKSDMYVMSWNVLLQHFNVVSNLPQIIKCLSASELHPNYNNSIYPLKTNNVIHVIKSYTPDIICLQEADEILSNSINKITFKEKDVKLICEKEVCEKTTSNEPDECTVKDVSKNPSDVTGVNILQETFNPYTSILCDRGLSTGLRTGVLTAFNTRKFKRLFTITIPFSNLIETEISKKYLSGFYRTPSSNPEEHQHQTSSILGMQKSNSPLSYPYNRQSSALIVALENVKTRKCVVVLNVHTYWSPSYEGVRVLEGINCLENLKVAVGRVKKHIASRDALNICDIRTGGNVYVPGCVDKKGVAVDEDIAVLLCGDLNDKPSNELYALISKGYTDYMVGVDPEDNDSEDNIRKHLEIIGGNTNSIESLCDNEHSHPEDKELEPLKTHTYTHDLKMKSSLSILPAPKQQNPTNLLGPHKFGGEPYSTTKTPTFEATIDYIFHNPAVVVSEVVVDNLLNFIPSNDTPSDHRVGVVGFTWGKK